jgi:hypothetical protein
MKSEAIRFKNRKISATIVPTLSDSVTRSIRTTFSVHAVARALEHGGFVAVREKGSHRRDRLRCSTSPASA